MKTKAIGDLAQLPDPQLFAEIAAGLRLTANSAFRLEADATALAEKDRARGCEILANLAEEEAAKYLILLDAVRCPRGSPDFGRQLAKFNQHLAKGLYAEAAMLRPAEFRELAGYIHHERREQYRDGDGEVDWICHNAILQRRETQMYVDYVRTESGHSWEISLEEALGLPALHVTGPAVRLVEALDRIGFSVAEALSVVASVWRPVQITDDLHWSTLRTLNQKTLEAMNAKRLLRPQPEEAYQYVVDRWPFPMHSLDMTLIKNSKGALKGR